MARKTIITITHTEADNGQVFTITTIKGSRNFSLDELNKIIIAGKNDFFKTILDQAKKDKNVLNVNPGTITKKGRKDVN